MKNSRFLAFGRLLSLFIAFFMVVDGAAILKAQPLMPMPPPGPLARFVTPTNGATGVSVNPTITLITKWKIDRSSINHLTHMIDTVPFDKQTGVVVLSRYVKDSVADSLWYAMTNVDSATLVNDTTLILYSAGLHNATEYVAIISNLRVIDALNDTIPVPDTIQIRFTTAYGTQQIFGSSVLDSSGRMRCSDTLRVYFNQPLYSANTPTGPLFEIDALNPTNDFPSGPSDTTAHYMYTDSLVPSTSWLDPSNSSVVCIKGTSLEAGQPYLFREWVSRLTGDSTQNRVYTLNVKGSAAIHLSQIGIARDSTYPDRSIFTSYTLHPGDTGMWVVPAIADSFMFSHWLCPGHAGIDGSTNDTLKVTSDCSTLQDLNISAVYFPLPIDTLNIDSLSPSRGDSISVYNQDGTLIGATGAPIRYPIRQNKVIIIEAHPATGYVFDHWNSNNGSINGSRDPFVPIKILGPVWATPVFLGPPPPTGVCGLCGTVRTSELYWTNFSTDGISSPYAELTGSLAGLHDCFPEHGPTPACTDPTAYNGDIALQINTLPYANSNYMPGGPYSEVGLWQTIIDGVGIPASPSVSAAVLTASHNHLYTDPPSTPVVYDVHRFNVKLQVDIEMSDGSQTPSSLGLVLGAIGTPTGAGTVFLNADQDVPPVETPWSATDPTHKFDEYDVTYKAGVTITQMDEAPGGEYQFVNWTTQTSTDGGNTWFASTDAGVTWGASQNVSTSFNWGGTQIHANADCDWDPKTGTGTSGTIIKVVAVFQKKFTLLTIAVDQDPDYRASATRYTYSVGTLPPDETGTVSGQWANDGSDDKREIMLTGDPYPCETCKPTLRVVLHFSDTLDQGTLWEGTPNLRCVEQQERIDYVPALTYFVSYEYYGTAYGSKYTLADNSDGTSTLTWDISTAGGYALTNPPSGVMMLSPPYTPMKLQKYGIQLTSGLKSIHGVALSNPTTGMGFVGETINPNVTWTAANTVEWCINDGCGCFLCTCTDQTNETYLVTSGAFSELEGASGGSLPADTFQSHRSDEHDIGEGGNYHFNTPILSAWRPRDASAFTGAVVTMDQDNSTIFNALGASLSSVDNAGKNEASTIGNDLLSLSISAIGLLNFGQFAEAVGYGILQLAGSSLFNQDDIVGKNVWAGTKENWWGGLPQYVGKEQNATKTDYGQVTTTLSVTLK